MASDTKKVQTIVNVCADQATAVRAAIDTMKAMRTLFLAANPSTVGTPLAGGNTAILNSAITALDTLVNTTDAAIWNALIAAKVPTHTGNALD